MAPIGFDMSDDLDDLTGSNASTSNGGAAASPASILVLSCQQAAGDGSYQSLVQSLIRLGKGQVEMHMFDRVVEGGESSVIWIALVWERFDLATTLTPAQYHHISILLPSTLITPSLLGLIEPSLAPGGVLQVHGQEAASSESVANDLKAVPAFAGNIATDQKDPTVLLCSKPIAPLSDPSSTSAPAASSSDAPSSTSAPSSVALPLRSFRAAKAAKASLWAFTSSNGAATPTIDESTLLTPEDLERPSLVEREDCNVKKTRKACKNCSCGLRELLLQEKDDLGAAGFAEGTTGVNGADPGVGTMGVNVTSSCGSCYLGDAFRCASCPYLGMPAFEPGQKVTIGGHDDKPIA
ncbi:BZ3500_MvSof-1268-A1-R1_Chr1-3g02088 [Microbotryum saponariae]|uniref:BZ3500_MvSof-1268-A1-R1_Chr1-3g02088 protein n=1 Tax=Microbotryum saponariae TaxID=289078 RepID=A0A2X0KI42_9BASI|nr:BZ3500_MvSof-1268-A1-R1_Chr1-3g02088 [Microbotryum saponariae]SCZ95390.1 BZ3501_MvSof-1269-A2-R1_Chr1-3g01690 [Microbotryum saponariae]